jgi:hypothetical protein
LPKLQFAAVTLGRFGQKIEQRQSLTMSGVNNFHWWVLSSIGKDFENW